MFREERPLFREKNLKPLVHRDLGIVRFNLPKVRIDGGIQHQAVFDHDLGVESGFGFHMLAGKTVSGRIPFIQGTKGAHGAVGNELHVSPGRDSFKTLEGTFLREPALKLATDGRIIRTLAVTGNHAGQDYPPVGGCLLAEAQRLEWNLKQHYVSAAGDFSFRAPDRVPTVIRTLILGKKAVLLDAVTVGVEDVGMAAVMERVQEHSDLVVIVN